MEDIVNYIRLHPGSTPADIRSSVFESEIGYNGMPVNVIHALQVLRLRGAIENHNTAPGKPGRWHIVGSPQ